MNYENNELKTVVVIKSGIRASEAINAAVHLALGLPGGSADRFRFEAYGRRDETVAMISTYPVIVMASKSDTHLGRFLGECREAGIDSAAFIRTMIGPSLAEQLRATAADESPDYLAVVAFGPGDALRPLTKRFSLLQD